MTGLLRSAVSIGLAFSAGIVQRPAPQAPRLGEPATLIGALWASDGQPIAGARVQLATLDLRPVLEVTTDAEGALRMTPVEPGQYVVRLIEKTHAVELEYVRFLSGRTVTVHLRKGVGGLTGGRRQPRRRALSPASAGLPGIARRPR